MNTDQRITEAARRLVSLDLALQAQGRDLPEDAYVELDELVLQVTTTAADGFLLGTLALREAYDEAGVEPLA